MTEQPRSTDYAAFLASKQAQRPSSGCEPGRIHKSLYPFQSAIAEWAVRRGRAAVFADCGLGKTRIQLEFLRHVPGPRSLIVAPLCVAEQTIEEAREVGLRVTQCTEPVDLPGIWITNYERLHNFIGHEYDAIVLDESSILKSIDGKTRTMLLREFTSIPFRLCCTATPAPNDIAELANHAEFLGIMSRPEMLASFFVNDASGKSGGVGWRLKGHAQEEFWRWLALWSVYIRLPSDLGFEDADFALPPIEYEPIVVQSDYVPEGMLFPVKLNGIQDRSKVRRATMTPRVEALTERIARSTGQWVVWCGLNDEGAAMKAALGDSAVLIEGSTPDSARVYRHDEWITGEVQTLISKPSIFGFGMNWQHCHQVAFLGLGDSYESYYQAVRRCWRFGQKQSVSVVVVTSNAEADIVRNIKRKERDADRVASGIIAHMRDYERAEIASASRTATDYEPTEPMRLPSFLMGDAA